MHSLLRRPTTFRLGFGMCISRIISEKSLLKAKVGTRSSQHWSKVVHGGHGLQHQCHWASGFRQGLLSILSATVAIWLKMDLFCASESFLSFRLWQNPHTNNHRLFFRTPSDERPDRHSVDKKVPFLNLREQSPNPQSLTIPQILWS